MSDALLLIAAVLICVALVCCGGEPDENGVTPAQTVLPAPVYGLTSNI